MRRTMRLLSVLLGGAEDAACVRCHPAKRGGSPGALNISFRTYPLLISENFLRRARCRRQSFGAYGKERDIPAINPRHETVKRLSSPPRERERTNDRTTRRADGHRERCSVIPAEMEILSPNEARRLKSPSVAVDGRCGGKTAPVGRSETAFLSSTFARERKSRSLFAARIESPHFLENLTALCVSISQTPSPKIYIYVYVGERSVQTISENQ